MRVVTRSKNIEATQISGDIHIEDTNGEVNIVAVNPLGNIVVNNKNQPVTLTLPQNANFTINGNTNEGDVETDFPLNVNGSDNRHNVSGQVGKGGSQDRGEPGSWRHSGAQRRQRGDDAGRSSSSSGAPPPTPGKRQASAYA